MRTVGTPKFESVFRIHIPHAYVIHRDERRYVFAEHVTRAMRALSYGTAEHAKLYMRYHQTLHRNRYNVLDIYGIKAIDIDEPQSHPVSVRLEFVLGEGTDAFSTRY